MWMSGSSNMWWGGSRKLFSTASYQPAVAIAICLLLKSLRLDQPLPSNLLKTVFPMQLTIHKCQRKQHWVTFKSVTEFGRWYNDLDIYVLYMKTMYLYSHPIIAQGPWIIFSSYLMHTAFWCLLGYSLRTLLPLNKLSHHEHCHEILRRPHYRWVVSKIYNWSYADNFESFMQRIINGNEDLQITYL